MDFIRLTVGETKLVTWLRIEEISQIVQEHEGTLIYLKDNKWIGGVNETTDEIMQAIQRINGQEF